MGTEIIVSFVIGLLSGGGVLFMYFLGRECARAEASERRLKKANHDRN